MLDAALRYAWFADRHNWTPEQVDNLPWLMQERLMAVALVRDEIERNKRKHRDGG